MAELTAVRAEDENWRECWQATVTAHRNLRVQCRQPAAEAD